MRVLVTGGAGFIGSAIARRLIGDGHQVIVADDLSTGYRENVPSKAEFLQLDLSRPASLQALPSAPVDVVCHLAAQSSGAVSEEDPCLDLQVNVMATLLLVRWCLARGIKRFLYASSMAVYGDGAVPMEEDALCVPKSHYGVSKLTSEQLLRLAAQQGISCTSFRMFSVYGPGQNLENLKQGMVSIYLAYMLRGVSVPVTGSLERIRDFIYIDDVVEVWMRALLSPHTPSAMYNLGSGAPVTVRELLTELRRALDLPADYPVVEQAGSEADQQVAIAETTRVCGDFAWRPQVDLKEGLKRMACWARTAAQVTS